MGQGRHVKLVWGTTEPIERPEETHARAEALGGWECWPRGQYESHNPWCGFVVGATNGVAWARHGEIDLDRFAIPLDELAAFLEREAPGALAQAKRRWDAFREQNPEFPPGRLLFVAEYD
jgi:hypothetical protein